MNIIQFSIFSFLLLQVFIISGCSSKENVNRNLSSEGTLRLNFIVEEDYLITHTLLKMTANGKNSQTAKDFQNYAWKVNKGRYIELKEYKGRKPDYLKEALFKFKFDTYLTELKNSQEYRKLLKETQLYKDDCEDQWRRTVFQVQPFMERLTGFSFEKINDKVKIYITHPAVGNGSVWDRDSYKITWGRWGNFQNYTTIYLWHEILHFYMESDEMSHAIIQLASDNELKKILNQIDYPPFEGHQSLNEIMRLIYEDWQAYLKSPRNLKNFAYEMGQKFKK